MGQLDRIDVLPLGLRGKESACNAGAAQDVGLIPGLERPLEEGTATHSSILAWRIPQTRSLVGSVPGVSKSRTGPK